MRAPAAAGEECPIPAGANPHLVRQVSAAPCRMGSTYGFTDRVIWVSNGCRGLFEVRRGGGGGGDWQNGGGANVTRISCASQSASRQECEVPGATRVRLARQISANPCVLNQSYGIGFGHIWVSNGCRGEFDVTVGGPGDGTGVPGLPGRPAGNLRIQGRRADRVPDPEWRQRARWCGSSAARPARSTRPGDGGRR